MSGLYTHQEGGMSGNQWAGCPLISERVVHSPVGGLSTAVAERRVDPSELPSCQTLKVTVSSSSLYHLCLSPINWGSHTPVLIRRNVMFEGVRDHSARNSTAWE